MTPWLPDILGCGVSSSSGAIQAPEFPYFLATESRSLTSDEYAIVERLVSGLSEGFKQQLPRLIVVGRCGCGECPTIFFQVHQKGDQEQELVSFQGVDSKRNVVGVALLGKTDVLSQLEFYALSGEAVTIPDPQSLVPIV